MHDLSCFPLNKLAAGISLALSLANVSSVHANDVCTGTTTKTCEGDQSSGVQFSPPVRELNVGHLTTDIAPIAPGPGIQLLSHTGLGLSVNFDGSRGISTTGNNAFGINVQSVGGNGSRGGGSTLGTADDGHAGGGGGSVSIISQGNIATGTAPNASGIFAVSGGGVGGQGGESTVGAGGDGGEGGHARAIEIRGTGIVLTSGEQSPAIVAISQAGNGGNGGEGHNIGSGGDGGVGGDGGAVNVEGGWTIATLASNAAAIYASSKGGTGGTAADGGWFSGGGGAGGASGDGGAVVVSYSLLDGSGFQSIGTVGADSHGIFAQSLGGFAGSGGDSGWLLSSGGDGGSAGSGGGVSIASGGVVRTLGDRSNALFAESVGGGGGSSGDGVGLFSGGAGDSQAGGNGGAVTVANMNLLQTAGAQSRAILAQSVGGSGGNAGSSSGAWFSIGATGGRGGHGGSVEVNNVGQLATSGFDSSGIFAQSVGGGGGSGGNSKAAGILGSMAIGGKGGGGGAGGDVHVASSGELISTSGDLSSGVAAQSVGGGGGKGGFAISAAAGDTFSASVTIGGEGGEGGSGGKVSVLNQSRIATEGADAPGIAAQSGGGGGGSGGYSIALAVSGGYSFSVSIGGKGGKGGDGGTVSVGFDPLASIFAPITGDITTFGSRSSGIQALSTGGGGGAGGFSISTAASTGWADSFSFSMGGEGGAGGAGSTVSVLSASNVSTRGDDAYGIAAQSVGGGGGAGGFSVAGGLAVKGAPIAISIGGAGGVGGSGGAVGVGFDPGTQTIEPVRGVITTTGERAAGILAQSTGKGGGSGGFSVAGGISLTSGDIGFSLGGAGGGGGIGGNVVVHSAADIRTGGQLLDGTTFGASAYGILAESSGGSGGSGGFSVAGGISSDGGINVSVGGDGGAGGKAGDVTVANSGAIATDGDSATGIQASTTGGNGGSGGFSVAGTLDFRSGGTNIDVSVGGGGGDGSKGGMVTVNNDGTIDTTGSNASGIDAQSIGGNGGKGGFSAAGSLAIGSASPDVGTLNLAFSLGGAGGDGNVGGDVTVTNTKRITTQGDGSDGIFAQSTGGSGGAGGNSLTGVLGLAAANKGSVTNLSASIGGFGGDGNNGGAVTVTNQGLIETSGYGADGIYAQSIGGGGGDGGDSNALSLHLDKNCSVMFVCKKNANANNNVNLAIAVGGFGGGASDAGVVIATNSGDIITHYAGSNGISAQSIGGGGGNGGNGTNGLESKVESVTGKYSQMGKTYKSWQVIVGGSGGSSGDGGQVHVSNSGNITTLGKGFVLEEGALVEVGAQGSYGILAQSVGGGGGTAIARGGDATVGLTGKIGLGGAAGSTGDGGDVTVENSGQITTWGRGATAIVAQSVGGGGGIAGDVNRIDVPFIDINTGINIAFGLGGGNGGNGGDVSVINTGDVTTHGDGAFGILAQSVGGGGGVAGNPGFGGIPLGNLFGTVGGKGSSGAVSVTQTGNITTLGDETVGIFAQSTAGTTGIVTRTEMRELNPTLLPGVLTPVDITTNFENASGAQVNVTLAGNIVAEGRNSIGIFVQSRGETGGGDMSIAINSGAVRGGTVAGVGVKFLGGANNLLTNYGDISALSGMGIAAGDAAETVDNFGIVAGSVDLGIGANTFNNHAGSQFNSGTTVHLGAGRLLTNDGTLSPGGAALALTTSVTGDLVQSHSGVYQANVDHATNRGDRVDVSGSASLAGQVQVSNVNAGFATPGRHQVTILSSAGGVTRSGLGLESPSSAVVSYQLLIPDSERLALAYDVNFAPAGLNGNQRTIANHISGIQLAGGSSSLAPVVAALVDMPDTNSLAAAYDRLSPEPYLGAVSSTQFSSLGFSDAMHSCGVRTGPDRFMREGECGWMQFTGSELDHDGSAENMGFKQRMTGLSAGIQRAIGDGSWHRGFAFSYEHSKLVASSLSRASGNQGQIGVILKKGFGATSIAADLSAGYGRFHTDRYVNVPSSTIASSERGIKFVSGHVRVAHANEVRTNWYVKPMLDLGLSKVWFARFQERGAGGASLNVMGHDESYFTLTPAVEVAGEVEADGGTLIRPYVKLGITHFLSGTSPAITASFHGASAGTTPFTVKGAMDKSYANVDVGLNVLSAKGATLRIGYSGKFSNNVKSHGAALKYTMPF